MADQGEERHDRIYDKLEEIRGLVIKLATKVDELNGTQRDHGAWIKVHTQLTIEQLKQFETLTAASGRQHDYQQRQTGGIAAAKPLIIALWALTLAVAAAVGGWAGWAFPR